MAPGSNVNSSLSSLFPEDDDLDHLASGNATKMKELLVAKVVSMLVLGLASLAIGLVPLKLTKLVGSPSGPKGAARECKGIFVSLLLCFGGGVLLFTTFIHLQPEVRESLAHLNLEEKIPILTRGGIPLSELVFCFGFFFVYLIEEIVHAFLDRKTSSHGHDALHRSLSVKCSSSRAQRNLTIPRVSLNKLDDSNSISFISNSTKELLHQHNVYQQQNNNYSSCSSSTKSALEESSASTPHEDDDTGKRHHHHTHAPSTKHPFRGFLTVLALSFHAVFEGLAVGLEGSVQKTWYLFAAIATHKLVIAFCVGVELVASGTHKLLVLVYVGTFALVTPLGIGIGIALSKNGGPEEDAVSVILQGMAAGTLLYVVFFEVLARERSNRHSGLWQLVSIIAGFGIMFGLQLLTGHEHGSSDSAHSGHHHHHHHHPLEHDFSLH